MDATTLHQPWASLVAFGWKTEETRDYAPMRRALGTRIAIHAAKRPMTPEQWEMGVYEAVEEIGHARIWDQDHFPLGAVVATAVLTCAHRVYSLGALLGEGGYPPTVACLEHETSLYGADRNFCKHHHNHDPFVAVDPYGNFDPGRWIWGLSHVHRLATPIPASGSQGWWRWDPPGGVDIGPALSFPYAMGDIDEESSRRPPYQQELAGFSRRTER